MKLVSHGPAGRERPGVLVDGGIILDLASASGGELRTIVHVLDGGQRVLDQIHEWVESSPQDDWLLPAEGVRLGPPVTNPSKVVCVGLNYKSHAEEQDVPLPKWPLMFSKSQTSLSGDGDPIWYPQEEEHLDYEAELAFVIGRRGFRIKAEDWETYVAGYTVVNDVSARDAQRADRKWFRGKSYDSCCPMGPYIVTRDEITDPHDLRVTSSLNGEPRQDGHTSDLIFSIPQILAFASRNMTFLPGDVVATGTPCGVGIFRDPPACMKPGDEITACVERIGRLTNRVCARTAESPSVYPAPRF